MQIRTKQPIELQNADGTTNLLPIGTTIADVEAVHLCRMSPTLRSVQIRGESTKDADGSTTRIDNYLLLPAITFEIEQEPGWEAYARRQEESAKISKKAA